MATGRILFLWTSDNFDAINFYHCIIDVLISRIRRIFTVDHNRNELDVFDVDEGTVWSHAISIPLVLLQAPINFLQSEIEHGLTMRLNNLQHDSAVEIARGIALFIQGVDGGLVRKFRVGVELEIVEREVIAPPPPGSSDGESPRNSDATASTSISSWSMDEAGANSDGGSN